MCLKPPCANFLILTWFTVKRQYYAYAVSGSVSQYETCYINVPFVELSTLDERDSPFSASCFQAIYPTHERMSAMLNWHEGFPYRK